MADDNDFFGKNHPEDWFASIKDIFENPAIPEVWLEYLQKIYAYLIIGAPVNNPTPTKPVTFTKIQKSGWLLYDYGDRIAVCAGDYAHGLRESDRTPEGNASPGYGTIVAQSWNSAQALVTLAKKRWPEGALFLEGTPFMKFALGYWLSLNQYKIDKFSIHKSDELAYIQIKTLLGQQSMTQSDQRPT
jgi:hypothetical protein